MTRGGIESPTRQNQGADTTASRRIYQPPMDETESPLLEACVTKPRYVTVLPHDASLGVDDTNHTLVVDVMKRDDPQRAYMRIRGKEAKSLDHHGPGWGKVYFAVVLRRVGENTFQCPNPDDAELVAIKRLSKAVVDESLRQGKRENPYIEIQRMQTFGDNIHVLGLTPIEGALQDEHYLYCIMPYCERESLVECIPWRRGIREDVACTIYANILENIRYLHVRGICHRDLSPDNCLILRGRIVFHDLAMSFRIPESGNVMPMGCFGKPAYLPPEVFLNYPFEAAACDLWASAVILFNLVTGEILCEVPHPSNLLFRYLVLARGLSRIPENERTIEILMDLEEPERSSLQRVAEKCIALSPEVIDLMEGILRVSVTDRWNIVDVWDCPWMRIHRQQRE